MPAAHPVRQQPIVLVGLMGAGKSTVGRLLARRLGLAFTDSDEAVEEEAGQPIKDIFETQGESGFRMLERAQLTRLLDGEPRVIAAGGGAFVDPDVRKTMLREAFTIWLDADTDLVAQRIGSKTGRPLIDGKDVHDTLRQLAAERGPAYAEAHLRIPCGSGSPDAIVDRIVAALGQRR